MYKIFLAALILISFSKVKSQNQLPDFSVEDVGNNKVRISWINPFGEACIQLTAQSSFDSVKRFKTIFSTESPQLPQNGFVYTSPFKVKCITASLIYWLVMLFIFHILKLLYGAGLIQGSEQLLEKNEATRIITISKYDSIVAQIFYSDYKSFKDSIIKNTKDTLFIASQDELIIKPYNPFNSYKPSIYVVTNPDGYVELNSLTPRQKNTDLFFLINGKKLFTLNHITDTDLVIDKANFQHAGWFNFELYENDKLQERSKILLQKDF